MAQIMINDRYLAGTASPLGRTQETGAVAPPSARKRAAGGAAAAGGDSVELSGIAAKVGEMLATDHAGRTAQIGKLTLDVQAGTYHVDAMVLSRKIVADALKLSE